MIGMGLVIAQSSERIKIVGLTGGIGSGKSTVAKIFKEYGSYVVDADKIAHEIMEPNLPAYNEILEFFGDEILYQDGRIKRKALAEIVFKDKSKLEVLNSITHKYIFIEMQRQIDYCIKNHKHNMIILDVPLLFNSDFPIHCDKTVAVVAERNLRIRRTIERDKCTAEKVEERMKNQLSDERLKELADYNIDNSGGLTELYGRVRGVYDDIMKI